MKCTDTLLNKTTIFILQPSLPTLQSTDQPKIYTHISCDGDKMYTTQSVTKIKHAEKTNRAVATIKEMTSRGHGEGGYRYSNVTCKTKGHLD